MSKAFLHTALMFHLNRKLQLSKLYRILHFQISSGKIVPHFLCCTSLCSTLVFLQERNPHCINTVCAMGVFRSQMPKTYCWCSIIHCKISFSPISPDASARITSLNSFWLYDNSHPFNARKTNIVCAPSLLFPSNIAWFFTNPKQSRAAFAWMLG